MSYPATKLLVDMRVATKTVKLRQDVHRRVRVAAAKQDRTVQDVFEEAVLDWLRRGSDARKTGRNGAGTGKVRG